MERMWFLDWYDLFRLLRRLDRLKIYMVMGLLNIQSVIFSLMFQYIGIVRILFYFACWLSISGFVCQVLEILRVIELFDMC